MGRYPHLADDIREILPAMVRLERALDPVQDLADPSPASHARFRDFRIVREIGRGGMGVVYEAEQVSLGRPVALKVLTQRMLRDATQRLRFVREARAAARLHHTNIVPVFGFGEHDGIPYYVMQLIEGSALDAVIDEVERLEGLAAGHPAPDRRTATMSARSLLTGRFSLLHDLGPDEASTPPEEPDTPSRPIDSTPASCPRLGGIDPPPAGRASGVISSVTQPKPDQGSGSSEARRLTYWQGVARLGVQIASALDYAHRSGVLHRDVKPSNLLLDASGTGWVTDFGLAKADDHQDLTATGDLLGTLRYMPPEAFEGRSDARSDVYSLGLTLYELVALRPAFGERDRTKLIRQVCHDEAARLRAIRPGVPRDLETIVHKAIEKEPSRRYPTAGELAADLQRFLDDQPIRARRTSTAERVARWSRRHKAWAAVLVGAAVLLVAATVVSTFAASYFQRLAAENGRLAGEREQQRSEAEAARGLAERRGEELRATLYRAEMNLAAQAAAVPGGVARVADLARQLAGRPARRPGLGVVPLQRADAPRPDGPRRQRPGRRVGRVEPGWDPDRLGRRRRLDPDLGRGPWPRAAGLDGPSGRRALGRLEPRRGPDRLRRGRQVAPRVGRGRRPPALRAARPRRAGEVRGLEPGCDPDRHRRRRGLDRQNLGRRARRPSRRPPRVDGPAGPDRRVARQDLADPVQQYVWPGLEPRRPPARDLARRRRRAHLGSGPRRPASRARRPRWQGRGRGVEPRRAAGSPRGSRGRDRTHLGRRRRPPAPGAGRRSGPVSGLAWSPDGRRLASASHDQTVRVWELDGERRPLILEGHGDRVTAVAWSPDGRRIASSGEDGTVRIWDPDSSPDPLHLRDPSGAIGSLSWSPDGRRIASSSWDDRIVRIWDAEGGDPIRTLDCGPGGGHCVAWSPDGSRLAADRGDGHVAVWDAADGKLVLDFRWEGKRVVSLAWSPDGRRLAAAGWDTVVRIWAADGSPRPDGAAGPRHRGPCGGLVSRRLPPGVGRRGRQGPHLGSRDGAIGPAAGGPYRGVAGARVESGRPPDRLGRRGYDHPDLGPRDRRRPGRLAGPYRPRPVDLLERGWFAAGVRRRRTASCASGTRPPGARSSPSGATTVRSMAVAWDPDGRRLASAGEDRVVVIRDATPGYLADRSDRLLAFPKTLAGHRLRAEVLARRGDWDAAAAEFRLAMAGAGEGDGRAFLAGWWAAGPFDDPGHEPRPEDGLDLDSRASPWEPVEATADGRVELGRYLPPGHAGSAYAWLRVWSAAAAPVRLRIGASGRFRAWIDGRPILDAIPAVGASGTDEAAVTLPAGWSSLVFRVAAGGDRPALRAWIEHEADLARDRIDLLLVRGRWSEAGAEIEEQARSRPGTAAGHHDRAIRAARSRASWLRGRGKSAEADAAERMAALWSDRLKSVPANHEGHVTGHRQGRRRTDPQQLPDRHRRHGRHDLRRG